MANLLEQIGQGLKIAGGVASPGVFQANVREDEQFRNIKAQRSQMIIQLAAQAAESGSITPEAFQKIAQKYGLEGAPAVGPSIPAQRAQQQMQQEERLQQLRGAARQTAFGKPAVIPQPVGGEGAPIGEDGTGTLDPVNMDMPAPISERQATYANALIESGEPELVKEGESLLKTIREKDTTISPLKRLQTERAQAVQQYGENHPIVKQFDDAIAGTAQGDSSLQQKIQALMESGLSETQAKGIAAGRYTVSVNPISGERQVIDLSTGRPVSGTSVARQQTTPGTAISSTTDIAAGTGASGFFGNIANTITDALGFGLAAPDVDIAKNALDNLKVQTTTLMQAAVPGRPSVELLKRLDKIAVDPVSLTQGDARAQNRLKQTRDMLSTEISRMERDILSRPQDFRPDQLTETRLNYSQLVQLQREYDTVLSSFEKRFNEAKKTGIFQDGDRWSEYENGKLIYRWPSRESYDNWARSQKGKR